MLFLLRITETAFKYGIYYAVITFLNRCANCLLIIGQHLAFLWMSLYENSQIIFILFCFPAVPKVIHVCCHTAIWFGEVVVWLTIVVSTETTHLAVVGTG